MFLVENNALGARIFDVMIQRLASALLIKNLSLQLTSVLKRPTLQLFRARFIFPPQGGGKAGSLRLHVFDFLWVSAGVKLRST